MSARNDGPIPIKRASPADELRTLIDAEVVRRLGDVPACPCCGLQRLQQEPRAPSIIAHLLAMFLVAMLPAPLNLIFVIWAISSMFKPYRVWACQVCNWEGRVLTSTYRILLVLGVASVLGLAVLLMVLPMVSGQMLEQIKAAQERQGQVTPAATNLGPAERPAPAKRKVSR